jgi:hypothetical protein
VTELRLNGAPLENGNKKTARVAPKVINTINGVPIYENGALGGVYGAIFP